MVVSLRDDVVEVLLPYCSALRSRSSCVGSDWCRWEAALPPPPNVTFGDGMDALSSTAWPACLQGETPDLLSLCTNGTAPEELLPSVPQQWDQPLLEHHKACPEGCAEALRQVGVGCLKAAADMVCSLAAQDALGGLLDSLLSYVFSTCLPEERPWGCDYDGYCLPSGKRCLVTGANKAACKRPKFNGRLACSFGPPCKTANPSDTVSIDGSRSRA
ncbi:hypothetical protein N2152v2_006503 [Parachlorella kessleri]